jgi:hypothetical protein
MTVLKELSESGLTLMIELKNGLVILFFTSALLLLLRSLNVI